MLALTHVEIIGYCEHTPQELALKAQEKIDKRFLEFFGEYVLVIERGDEVYLCASPYGFQQYFYTIVNGQLFHGKTVLEVFKRSGLPWEYNYQALGDITGLEHLLEEETLHPKIKRVPAATIISFTNGQLKLQQYEWEDFHNPPTYNDHTPEQALCYFNRHVERTMTDENVVMMSGGLDSRLILSALLKLGAKPKLLTVGFDDTGDVIVARQVAQAYSLDFEQIELDIDDYLHYGKAITQKTGGTMTADHFHFHLATLKGEYFSNATYFYGTNGEYVRGNYADFGWLARLGNLAPSVTVPFFWRAYLRLVVRTNTRTIRADDLIHLHPEFARHLDRNGYEMRVNRLYNLSHKNFFPGVNERYLLEQRCRLFQSNHLVNVHPIRWSLPFMDRDWINVVTPMPLTMKLGSNWHRYAIKQNEPHLLSFMDDKTGNPIREKEHWWYWTDNLRGMLPGAKPKFRKYHDYRGWFAQPRFVEFIEDHKSLLTELFAPRFISHVLREHQTNGSRKKLLGFMMSQIYWRQLINEVTKPARRTDPISIKPITYRRVVERQRIPV